MFRSSLLLWPSCVRTSECVCVFWLNSFISINASESSEFIQFELVYGLCFACYRPFHWGMPKILPKQRRAKNHFNKMLKHIFPLSNTQWTDMCACVRAYSIQTPFGNGFQPRGSNLYAHLPHLHYFGEHSHMIWAHQGINWFNSSVKSTLAFVQMTKVLSKVGAVAR